MIFYAIQRERLLLDFCNCAVENKTSAIALWTSLQVVIFLFSWLLGLLLYHFQIIIFKIKMIALTLKVNK